MLDYKRLVCTATLIILLLVLLLALMFSLLGRTYLDAQEERLDRRNQILNHWGSSRPLWKELSRLRLLNNEDDSDNVTKPNRVEPMEENLLFSFQ